MLVLGLFSSDFVLPARACFGYFWFVIGMIMSVSLANRREAAYRRQMILSMAGRGPDSEFEDRRRAISLSRSFAAVM